MKKIFQINFKNIFLIYLFYILLICTLSFVFATVFSNKFLVMDKNNQIILENISFEFGELINNLYLSKGYFHEIEGIKYYLQKLPAIPFLLLSISKISMNYFFVVIFKNFLIFSLYFFLCYQFLKNLSHKIFFYLILIVPIFIPYNLSVALNYVYEDCIIAILLPILFISLVSKNKNRFTAISVILFVLYLTKTSMFLLTLILPLVILLYEKKIFIKLKILPLISVIFAISIWGYFGHVKTGKIPFGSSGASNNSFVLSHVLNQNFKDYYPKKSLDIIPLTIPDKKFISEWDRYKYYDKKNKNYLKKNYKSYLFDCVTKIKFILFGIHRDSALPDENGYFNNKIRFSLILNKLFLNLSFIILLINLYKNYKANNLSRENLYYLLIIVLNFTPHVVGWATSKHLVASTSVSIIYLIFQLKNKKIRN
tara:strand:- start:4627 stop:5901 length:1275 start_codon:yes stop_codon:yes gene_type:complete